MRDTIKDQERVRNGWTAAREMIRRHDEREARLAEHFKVLWSMSAAERVSAMRRGQLSFRQLMEWARRSPKEVPTINGEWEFIAVWTPEIADRDPEQDSR